MMRRFLPLLLACLMLLSGCAPRDPLQEMASEAPEAAIPAPQDTGVIPREQVVTLWFRFGEWPMLAPETRALTLSPTAPCELTILQALAAGPAAASLELTGLFPPGTRVLATHRQDRTLFVTLSQQILNDYADEKNLSADEAALRRRLAMQAIAATATENCDVDAVVILLDQADSGSGSIRLLQSYYRDGGSGSALAAPLLRDESVLLTAGNTLQLALDCWQKRDWARLYPLIARSDAATGQPRPDYETFAAQMEALPHLTGFSASAGSVSPDGQSAVFTASLQLLDAGQTGGTTAILRLQRERDVWRIGLSQLTGREGTSP